MRDCPVRNHRIVCRPRRARREECFAFAFSIWLRFASLKAVALSCTVFMRNYHRIVLAACLLFVLNLTQGVGATTQPKQGTKPKQVTKPATPTKRVDDPATANRKREARRSQLAGIIARNQSIMDQYDKQNSFELSKRGQTGLTSGQYQTAKAARDQAQRERDELAN